MRKINSICLGFIFITISVHSQEPANFYFASTHCRDSVTRKLVQQIEETIQLPVNETTYTRWAGTFWAMELILYKLVDFKQRIPAHIKNLPEAEAGFQRSYLEMLYTLYPKSFVKEILSVWKNLADDKVKASKQEKLGVQKLLHMVPPSTLSITGTKNIFPIHLLWVVYAALKYGMIKAKGWLVCRKNGSVYSGQ